MRLDIRRTSFLLSLKCLFYACLLKLPFSGLCPNQNLKRHWIEGNRGYARSTIMHKRKKKNWPMKYR